MNKYTSHVVEQWLDRQVYDNVQDMSRSMFQCIREGRMLAASNLSTSVVAVIADGMDQAKFKVPRRLVQSHAFETLLRPALSVHGVWAHGAGYELGVADADLKKDTGCNIECIVRLLSGIKDRHGILPLGLHLQQDNTSRECKNQRMVQFAIALVSIKVFRWVTLSYPTTGHTHSAIDQTFGQLAVKLSHREPQDDKEVVAMLNEFLPELGIDTHSRANSRCYKLDEAADWQEWIEQHGVNLSSLTGPGAPHYFRICLRGDIAEKTCAMPHARQAERQPHQPTNALAAAPEKDDVMMVTKSRMHSAEVSQVLWLLPAANRRRMLRRNKPLNVAPRRDGGEDVKAKVARKATALFDQGEISLQAEDYQVQWSSGTRPRAPRPESYSLLRHRWQDEPPWSGKATGAKQLDVKHVRVAVLGISGQPLPDEAEEMEDEAPLIIDGPR